MASVWFPEGASQGAEQVDRLFFFVLTISVFFFFVILSAMTLFTFRYRRRDPSEVSHGSHHNTWLEITWSVIPGIIVAVIFVWGFLAYLNMRTPPDGAYEIQVIARKWSWSFVYPNGHVDSDLHVPIDRPVRLVMSSDDVIHSLFVPAFRIKMDLVPGRYTETWFEANRVGEYTLYCAEYCGTQHSTMLARVVVHPSGEFEPWLEKAANLLETLTPVEAGEVLYLRRGCAQCHSVDGSAKSGPTFLGAYGTTQLMTSGASVVIDENYLRESILEPQAKIRAGYKPVMPTYQGQLRDEEIAALIAYIKSLQ
jgi:cytochrome c oxidase subunit II